MNATEYMVDNVRITDDTSLWWLIIVIAVIAIASYILYKRFYKVKQNIIEEARKPKPIDYRKEARKILEKAKQLFKGKQYKESYGKAAEAIRFYYSHKLEIKTELTNTKLLKILKENGIKHDKTRDCLNLCAMVEFAKYQANKKDFDEIIGLAEEVIV